MQKLKFELYMDAETINEVHSFAETIAIMTANIFGEPESYLLFSKIYPENEVGYIERLNTVIAWAKDFEQQNEGKEWDGEYMDEIDTFLNLKLN